MAVLQFSCIAEHQLVRFARIGRVIGDDNARSQPDFVGRNLRDVDVRQLGDALRELSETCLHELLPFQRLLVLAVLLQVAKFDGLPDFVWQSDFELVLKLFDFARHLRDEFLEHWITSWARL